ncbi:ATP-binding protein, partial [Alloalcanivorax gelatiniphagus]|uniref:ATP-binding protein n=1 Tax=Alloalcanivorax gelatiniphagus TaxID=1194167 RepID=UPI00360CB3E0
AQFRAQGYPVINVYPVGRGATLDDGRVGLCIDDQGPGLTPEQRRRALERGWRGHGGGRGLGLAIVTTIMARTDGRVALDRAPGGGLRVRVSWPPAGSA